MRPVALAALFASACTLAAADPPPAPPDDFTVVARFAPGYSDWLRWDYTITADGKVAQNIGPGGRGGGEKSSKEVTLKKDDVAALAAKVKEADFFKLKEQQKGKVTDMATLTLTVTADKKTHTVKLYGHRFLREKEERDEADRFLAVWQEVLKKVPAPNEKQTADLYKPGEYAKPRKEK